MSRRLLTVILGVALVLGVGLGVQAAGAVNTAQASGTTAAHSTVQTRTLTQPDVVTVPAVTTPEDTLPGYKHPHIVVGDRNTPEQFVVGEMYVQALSAEGYSVSYTRNVNAVPVQRLALEQGDVDVFPEYLNQWDTQFANDRTRFRSVMSAYAAGQRYARKHKLVVLKPTSGADTTGVVVTSEFARENHIYSLADLAQAPHLTLAWPPAVSGLTAAERAYGFKPGMVQELSSLGTQFQQLQDGEIQASYVTTTDPNLHGSKFTLLKDPKHIFGYGNLVAITTKSVERAEGPVFARTINRIDALLTDSVLEGLTDEVDEGHGPSSVAYEFLEGNGILPPTRYSTTG